MSYPTFVITQAANLVLTQSLEPNSGVRLDISQFRLGTSVAEPDVFDTDLIGSTVYSGSPSSYFLYDENTVGIRLEIPAEVGPFQFGEIGLFSQDGLLVARASFGELQTKFGPANGGMPSIWRITALLRTAQAPSVFIINTSLASSLLEVPGFHLLSAPGLMPSAQNAAIVHEPNPSGSSVLVIAHSPNKWSILGYKYLGTIVLSAQSSPGHIPSSGWASYFTPGYQPAQYLVQTPDGDIRAIDSVGLDHAIPVNSFPVVPMGTSIEVYGFIDQDVSRLVPASEFNALVTQFNSYWAAPTGTNVYDAKGLNQLPVQESFSSVVSPGEWYVFADAVMDYATLIGRKPSVNLRDLTSEWNADYFEQLRRYIVLTTTLESITTRRVGDVPNESLDVMTRTAVVRNATWSDIHYDSLFVFANEDVMRGYFNAGGWLGVKLSVVEDNYVQAIHARMLASLGTIAVRASKSESQGPMRIEWTDGDGVSVGAGNCGFLGLNSTPKTIWSHSVVAASATGMEAIDGVITYSLQASISGGTFMLSFRVKDTSMSEFINDTKGGSPSIRIQAQSARPSPGIINTPTVAHPTHSNLPSTVW